MHLSSEEHPPDRLVEVGRLAERAGFHGLSISDHFHPWTPEQGESAFVWAVLGALAHETERVPVITAVTCPTMRIHPVICAHAAATVAAMMPGRFIFGIGTGERLNENVLGDHWPAASVRREMLEEAVGLMRALWTGEMIRAHDGRHYAVDRARLHTLPPEPPPIVVSGFGERSAELAGRIGDGYMNTAPDPDLLGAFRRAGGEGKPAWGKLDCCVAASDAEARRIALATWPTSALSGEVGQELATPEHYAQAAASATEDQVAEAVLCSSDPAVHLDALREYDRAGYEHVLVQQCGDDQERLIELYREEILPRLD